MDKEHRRLADRVMAQRVGLSLDRLSYSEVKKRTLPVIALCMLFIICFGVIMTDPEIVGMTTGDGAVTYTEQMNLTLDDPRLISWSSERDGVLVSLRITGYVSGNGTAKVYLDDMLVFDRSRLSDKGMPAITGFAISTVEDGESPDGSMAYLNAEGDGTNPDTDYANFEGIGSWGSGSLDGLADGIAPVDDEDASEDDVDSAEDDVDSAEDDEDVSADLSADGNVTQWIADDNISTDEAGMNLDAGNTTSDVMTNVSIELTMAMQEFDGICIETCDIEENKSSYDLWFLVDDAVLHVESITYSIIAYGSADMADAVLINQTNQTLSNMTLANMTLANMTLENMTLANMTLVNITEMNMTLANATENATIPIAVNMSAAELSQDIQGKAVVGQPVRWTRQVRLSEEAWNLSVRLPRNAHGIKVSRIENDIALDIESQKLKIKDVDKQEADKEKKSGVGEAETGEAEPGEAELGVGEAETGGAELGEAEAGVGETETGGAEAGVGETETGGAEAEPGEEYLNQEAGMTESVNYISLAEYEDVYADADAGIFAGGDGGVELIIEDEILDADIVYYTEAPGMTVEHLGQHKMRMTIFSETHYVNITASAQVAQYPKEAFRLYRLADGIRQRVAIDDYADADNDSLVDMIVWTVSHLSNQTYELEIIVLNVQSYPIVGGNWTIAFNTTGTADLYISAFNDTTYYDPGSGFGYPYYNAESEADLEWLGLWCGNNSAIADFNGTHVAYLNWSCNSTGYHVSKVTTPGRHHQMLDFGGALGYAHNLATGIECNVTTSCGWTDLFWLSNHTNAHAEYEHSDYPYSVCCRVTGDDSITLSVSNESGDSAMLGISNVSDAHVEKADETDYMKMYLSMDYGTASCDVFDAACPDSYECLATISADTDAHIGDCDNENGDDGLGGDAYYTRKLCCGFGNLAPEVLEIVLTPEDPSAGDMLNCSFRLNEDNSSDSLSVNWYWLVNGSLSHNGSLSGLLNYTWYNVTLDPSYTNLLDIWTCRIEPKDQADLGKNASVQVEVWVLPPEITKLYPNFSLEEGYDSSLRINLTISEPNSLLFNITFTNNTAVSVSWSIDGSDRTAQSQTSGQSSEFLWDGNYSQAGSYLIKANVSNAAGSDYREWNLTVDNTNRKPSIDDISDIADVTITESGVVYVDFTVVADDPDGVSELDDATLSASFSMAGEATRYNQNCIWDVDMNATAARYNCTIGVWYWDVSGWWSANATIRDMSGLESDMRNESFWITETTAMTSSPAHLTWPQLYFGNTDVLANENIMINNTGNDNIELNNIRVQGFDLLGEDDASYVIPAANFSISTVAACGGTGLVNNTAVNIAGSVLAAGNNSAGLGQETLYVCMEEIPFGLMSQDYSASSMWVIDIV